MHKLRKSKGFTLIELMVVVAIIGILAAVAVPKFLAFLARSRKSEARTILTGVYNAEEAYFAEYEWYGDTGDALTLWRVGYSPAGQVGTYTEGAGDFTTCPPSNAGCTSSEASFEPNIVGQATGAGTPASGHGFGFSMCGNIDSDPTIDQWYLSEQRRAPCNLFDDITNEITDAGDNADSACDASDSTVGTRANTGTGCG